MAYIGQSLTEGTRRVYTYVATASQTTFNAVYGVGAVDVYQNGVLLAPSDYTASDGTTVVLGTGAAADDEITVVCHNTFSVADTLTASQGGTFTGDVTFAGGLNVTTSGDPDVLIRNSSTGSCSLTLRRNANDDAWTDWTFKNESGKLSFISDDTVQANANRFSIDYQGDVVFNEGGLNADFRVESVSKPEAIFVDASSDFIGFNGVTSAPWSQTTGDGRMVYRLNEGAMTLTNNRSTGYSPLYINKFGTGSDNRGIAFYHDGGGSGYIDITSSGVTYLTTSDRRLKDNIEPIADGTEKLMAMNPVTHTWKANPEADAVHGFIAQEMMEIAPEAVSGDPDGEEMMSMDYGRITPVLVAALQDAHKKIEALEERLTELEAK